MFTNKNRERCGVEGGGWRGDMERGLSERERERERGRGRGRVVVVVGQVRSKCKRVNKPDFHEEPEE